LLSAAIFVRFIDVGQYQWVDDALNSSCGRHQQGFLTAREIKVAKIDVAATSSLTLLHSE
jgi:hypothetical protein